MSNRKVACITICIICWWVAIMVWMSGCGQSDYFPAPPPTHSDVGGTINIIWDRYPTEESECVTEKFILDHYPNLLFVDETVIPDYRVRMVDGPAPAEHHHMGLAWVGSHYAEIYLQEFSYEPCDVGVANVTVHEVGHLLGLEHTNNHSCMDAPQDSFAWIEECR